MGQRGNQIVGGNRSAEWATREVRRHQYRPCGQRTIDGEMEMWGVGTEKNGGGHCTLYGRLPLGQLWWWHLRLEEVEEVEEEKGKEQW